MHSSVRHGTYSPSINHSLLRSADDTITKRSAAIKMNQLFQLPLSALRAVREFSILSTLKHPNVNAILYTCSTKHENERFRLLKMCVFSLHKQTSRVSRIFIW